jgi:hypothetical protein
VFTTLEIYVFYIITDDNIIQFGNVTNTAGSIVYIQYVGGKHTQNDWYCTASTTSSHDIQVSAVDVVFKNMVCLLEGVMEDCRICTLVIATIIVQLDVKTKQYLGITTPYSVQRNQQLLFNFI